MKTLIRTSAKAVVWAGAFLVAGLVLIFAAFEAFRIYYMHWIVPGVTPHEWEIPKDYPYFPAGTPPDPGPTGKLTLGGVDSDRDGVRDDVQRWIYYRFKPRTPQAAALRQTARYHQSLLESRDTREKSDASYRRMVRAGSCLRHVFAGEAPREGDMVQAKVLNTYPRIRKYLDLDLEEGFRIFESDKNDPRGAAACDS